MKLKIYPGDEPGTVEEYLQPEKRGECSEIARPCPFVSCRYHLAHDWIKPYYGKPPTDDEVIERIRVAPETCSLDVADRGGVTEHAAAEAMQTTKASINGVSAAMRKKMQNMEIDFPGSVGEDFDLWAHDS